MPGEVSICRKLCTGGDLSRLTMHTASTTASLFLGYHRRAGSSQSMPKPAEYREEAPPVGDKGQLLERRRPVGSGLTRSLAGIAGQAGAAERSDVMRGTRMGEGEEGW